MQKREVAGIGLAGIVLLGFYHLTFGPFFPNMHGKLGHDYAAFLPRLLDGYYWYRTNGLASVPWHTPSFCGGIPLLADPQSLYYSVPQFLSFVTDPLTSVYLTMLLFAGLGFAGFYLLLRQVFCTTLWTALLGAGLFLFNGFYAHRMLVGHLPFHPFMLIPFLAFFLLRRVRQTDGVLRTAHWLETVSPARLAGCCARLIGWRQPPLPVWQGQLALRSSRAQHPYAVAARSTYNVVMAGLLMAYMVYAGMVHVMLPVLATVVVIGLLYGMMQQQPVRFWWRLSLGGGLALALCSAKLVAALAYLHYFGRDGYRLPGIRGFGVAMAFIARALFTESAYTLYPEVFVNLQFTFDQHEFEFGVTFVPLVLLVLGGVAYAYRSWVQGKQGLWLPQHWFRIGGLVALLLLPVLLNCYTPAWNAVLKHIPILKNSALLFRWVSLYIPVVILLAVVGLDRMGSLRPYQPVLVSFSLGVVVLLNQSADRAYYHAQPYDPRPIVQAYQRGQQPGWLPAISHIAVFTDAAGKAVVPLNRNDMFTQGYSQLFCYEPLFGYRLEAFPIKTLAPGAVTEVQDGYFNLKNPACYVYPTSNGCAPGDHFPVQQRAAVEAFTMYRPFPFHVPTRQGVANLLNLTAVSGVMAFLLLYGWSQCRK